MRFGGQTRKDAGNGSRLVKGRDKWWDTKAMEGGIMAKDERKEAERWRKGHIREKPKDSDG